MQELKPISQSKRKPIVDILRGWALLSVALMNYSTIYTWNNQSSISYKSDPLTTTIQTISEILFESKGWTLHAILFGYGFSVLLINVNKAGQQHYTFFNYCCPR